MKLFSRKNKGFTLAEMIILIFTFSFLLLSMISTLFMGTKYMRLDESNLATHQANRLIMETITNELRQAMINPDPGYYNSPTGYYYIDPPVEATAVLYPNENTVGDADGYVSFIVFNGANPASFDPSSETFDWYDPQYYTQVKYYVLDNNVIRQVTTYDQQGNSASQAETPIAGLENGSVELKFKFINSYEIEVKVITEINNNNSESRMTVFLRTE